ncbi:hypothetical protein RN001_006328 [Aquatica leii]|uniref:Uncharacterized protein n=1 Tax=Aquatica leii TaxID=1421715 RepID=A0AAN7Q1M0_9COLE|nr:hypothetical protein RN001_006328 [Aquatica leii]
MPRTRSNNLCPVFGVPEEFKNNVLPTYADVIRYYLYVRQKCLTVNKQEPGLTDVCSLTSISSNECDEDTKHATDEKTIIRDSASSSQKRTELPNVAQACDRTDRAAAILINAA